MNYSFTPYLVKSVYEVFYPWDFGIDCGAPGKIKGHLAYIVCCWYIVKESGLCVSQ